jgi:hypothetical protein
MQQISATMPPHVIFFITRCIDHTSPRGPAGAVFVQAKPALLDVPTVIEFGPESRQQHAVMPWPPPRAARMSVCRNKWLRHRCIGN